MHTLNNIRYMKMKERIAQRMLELDMTQEDLAERTGLSQVSIHKILKGGGTRKLVAIAKALQCTAEDLAEGGPGSIAERPGKYMSERPIEILRFDLAGSMGSGKAAQEGYVDVVERIQMNREYLRRVVSFSAPENLAMITALGDSMAPTFNDCDLLLVDRGVTEIRLDAVYVITYRGELFVKRIQRRPGEPMLMISDNKAYEPIPIKMPDTENFGVMGRVLLAWNARKL